MTSFGGCSEGTGGKSNDAKDIHSQVKRDMFLHMHMRVMMHILNACVCVCV